MPTFQYLPLSVKNVSITLEDILGAMKETPSWEYKSLYFDRISSLYRQLGIGEFLLTDDETYLHEHLQLGIQAYTEFLQNANPSEIAISKILIFFDAVCLGDVELMAGIARFAPTTRNPRKEYEEDFLYMRILMDYFALQKTADDIAPLMKEFESLHVDYPDQRYSLLLALFNKDSSGFADALEVLIDERAEQYSDGGDLYKGTQDEASILTHMSTEVVAWIKLAKQQDLAVAQEYKLAPSTAMADCALPFPAPRSWLAYQSPHRSFKLS